MSGLLLATFCALAALPALAQTAQHSCQFTGATRMDDNGMQNYDVDWRVRLAHKGKRGHVFVTGSGDYSAKAQSYDSGAVEYAFKTDVSRELITIGPGGQALWEINFNNGDLLVYAGGCKAPKKVNG